MGFFETLRLQVRHQAKKCDFLYGQLRRDIKASDILYDIAVQFYTKGVLMGEGKQIQYSSSNAKLPRFENKVTAFKAIFLQKFHQEIHIQTLSALNFIGIVLNRFARSHKFSHCRQIRNHNAVVILSQSV